MRLARASALAVGAVAATVALAACSQASQSPSASGSPSTSATCTKDSLNLVTPGTLTVATSNPAYPPYVIDNKPENGKGFESAVAYAVAEQLGFAKSEVKWTDVTFEQSYAPGAKKFDFDINQVSITPERKNAVTFSDPYYLAPQALVTLKSSKYADAATMADIQSAKLGVQVGTTAYTFITNDIQPTSAPQVFNDTAAATAALKNGTIDAIVVDLPTADYIVNVELSGKASLVGQFAPTETDSWGLVLQKGNSLVTCLNQAIATLTTDGTLKALETKWLPFVSVPTIQ